MGYLIGVVLALVVGVFGTLTGFDRSRAFYPAVMVVIALLYGLFAVLSGSLPTLARESVGIIGFIIVTVVGFKRNLWWVAGALLLHGIYDLIHGHLIANAGVPIWYPQFCSAYDFVAAAYLAVLLLRRKDQPGI